MKIIMILLVFISNIFLNNRIHKKDLLLNIGNIMLGTVIVWHTIIILLFKL